MSDDAAAVEALARAKYNAQRGRGVAWERLPAVKRAPFIQAAKQRRSEVARVLATNRRPTPTHRPMP